MSELTGSQRDIDLSDALVALLRGDGRLAVDRAQPWLDTWIGKCITFLAYSWLLYEPRLASEVFGGDAAVQVLVQSNTVVSHVLLGVSALFKRSPTAVAALRRAAALEPSDPYVAFLYAFACRAFDVSANEQLRSRMAFHDHSQHPLFKAAPFLV